MTYIPTLKDIEELDKQSYTPTLKDITELESQNKKNTNPLIDMINNLGGGTAQGIQNLITKPLNLAGNLFHNQPLQNIKSIAAPFYNPNTFSGASGRFLGETIPETALAELGAVSSIAAPALENIPKIGQFLNKTLTTNKALDYATIGGLTNPNNPILGATLSGTLGGGINSLQNKILNKAARLKAEEKIPTLDEEAASIMQKLHPNKNLSKSENEQEAAHMIRNNYQNMKKNFNQRYENLFQPFETQGGNEIIQNNNLKTALENHNEDIAPLKGLLGSKKLLELQQIAGDNTPKDIRKLNNMQSYIGGIASDLRSSSEGLERRKGTELSYLRESLLNDMENAFTQKGMGNVFSNLRNDYRTKVIPYEENEQINKIIRSSPDKISNFDKLKEAFGSQNFHQEVANQGGNKLKNSILFDALSNSISTNKKVNPKTLMTEYDTLGEKNKDAYITPELHNMMEGLRKRLIEKYPNQFTQESRKLPDSVKQLSADTLNTLMSTLIGSGIGGILGHPTVGAILGGTAQGHNVVKELLSQKIPQRSLNLAIQSPKLQKALEISKVLPFAMNRNIS